MVKPCIATLFGAFAATVALAADAPSLVAQDRALPDWPGGLGRTYYGQERARAGTITVDFEVGADGVVYAANTAKLALPRSKRKSKAKYELEEDFDAQAVSAMLGWRFRVAAGACGTARAKLAFAFDGAANPPVSAGEAQLVKPDDAPAADLVLEPVLVAGSVADPALGVRGSMVRNLPFQVLEPPALSVLRDALPRAATGDLEPARVASWGVEQLVAASDPHVARQLVIARYTIGADGAVSGVDLDRRYGESGFEKAVAAVLAGARFTPARRAGAPVAVSVCQSFGSAMKAQAPSF